MICNARNPLAVVFLLLFTIACNGPNSPISNSGTTYQIAYMGQNYHLFTLEDIYAPRIKTIETSGDLSPYIKWSTSADLIAYISDPNEPTYSHGLFTIKPDGNDKKLLLPIGLMGVSLTTQLAWSPDGSKIAFISNIESNIPGEQNIWVVDKDGNNPTMVTDGGYNLSPTWFADGEHLVFLHIENSHEDTTGFSTTFQVVNLSTKSPPITRPEISSLPVFNADGSLMAVGRYAELRISEDLGETTRSILDESSMRISNNPIGFSADGQSLIFQSYIELNFHFSQAEIAVVNLDGTDRRVLRKVENLYQATLSPDRKKIMVWTWVETENSRWFHDIYILSVDGSEYFKLLEQVRSPDWGPVN